MQSLVLKKLKSDSIKSFILKVIGTALLFFMHMLIGRMFSTQGYGIFSYTIAIATVLVGLVTLGWSHAIVRFMGKYSEAGDWQLYRGTLVKAHQITFAAFVVVAAALYFALYFEYVTADIRQSIIYSLFLLLPLSFAILRRRIFLTLGNVEAAFLPNDIIVPLLVCSIILIFPVLNIKDLMLIYIIVMASVFVFASIWLWRNIPAQVKQAKSKFQTRQWMLIALPMLYGFLATIIINRTDILLLGLLDDIETVGVYAASVRIVRLLPFFLGAVTLVAAPLLSSAYHGNRISEFKSVIYKVMLWSSLATLPLFLLCLLLPEYLLSLFGNEFVEGAIYLRILAIGQFINAVTGPVGAALTMSEGEKQFGWTISITALINLIGNYFAILHYGALGAAVVTSISLAMMNLIQLYLVLRITRKASKVRYD